MSVSAIELAFSLARTGNSRTSLRAKKALKRNFAVERELKGRQLAADITRVCREARAKFDEASPPDVGALDDKA